MTEDEASSYSAISHSDPPTDMKTSRVIVKNLPKYSTPEMVRKHLSARGYTITDLKLARTEDGRFRRFAFVGFANDREARDCCNYFDSTFLDTARLEVSLALPFGDARIPRAWSRHSRGSSAYNTAHPEESEAVRHLAAQETERQRIKQETERKRKMLFSIYGADDQDPQMKEYMKAMKTKSQTKSWENDDNDEDSLGATAAQSKRQKTPGVNVEVRTVASRKAGGEGILIPKVHVKFNAEDDGEGFFEKSDDEDLYEDFPVASKPAGTEDESPEIEVDPESQSAPRAHQPSGSGSYEKLDPSLIAETGRLFVRNLAFSVIENDLQELFNSFGPINEIHIPIDRDTKRGKGVAFILFMLPEDALKAYQQLDGTIFQGRLLHILPAKEQKSAADSNSPNGSGDGSSYKRDKEAELKASSSNAHNWNSLFIRSDTVLDAIAIRLGVPKSSLMNVHDTSTAAGGASLATRLAIAETHIIQETREYLEAEGVDLGVFAGKGVVERSKTVILVKNLPFDVEVDELRTLFAKFGTIDRFILPPLTRGIALIEFLEANEAKAAFRALAYTKFRAAPLFLEWAPLNTLQVRVAAKASSDGAVLNNSKDGRVLLKESLIAGKNETSSGSTATNSASESSTSTLYIKNLSFKSDEEGLRRVFSAIGPIRSVRIPHKGDLSLGFGFVEFESPETVNRALDNLQNVQLDGHSLILKKSSSGGAASNSQKDNKNKKSSGSEVDEERDRPTKLLIRNVPFEANENELRSLLKSFTSALKRLRLPRKFDGSHRGFGFAEFTSHSEAKHVKETLLGTHFYGRHLVIEWAKSEEPVEQ